MKNLSFLATPVLWVLRKLMFVWVRTTTLPESIAALELKPGVPVCFVLERSGLRDWMVLDELTARLSLPRPTDPLVLGTRVERRSVFYLRQVTGIIFRRPSPELSPRLGRIVAAVRDGPDLDVQIVPVSVFWGRAPDKERSFFKGFFSENWVVGGRFRRMLTVLLHGRNTLVQFSRPMSLRQVLDEDLSAAITVRKICRILRVHYRRVRIATVGPDLSHRRTLINQLLESRAIREAVLLEAERKKIPVEKARQRARKHAYEIAADYSYNVVRLLERLLARFWNRIYDGVVINHFDKLRDIAEGNEIIYVPNHRSHIDYLLINYVVYEKGFVSPHVAAGINLNLPVIGRILRRGGAFFMRRSFKGSALYSAVFRQYLIANLVKGVPIEFFIEGGRSRTGRTLNPKPGMLSMIVRGYLSEPTRPVVFMPANLGYEKLVEGGTYMADAGTVKEKESLGGLIRAVRGLKGKFGRAYVNFAEPIDLKSVLDEYEPGWNSAGYTDDHRPDWLEPATIDLGRRIVTAINDAAAVHPVALLALVLLATPKRAMAEGDLARQLEYYLEIQREAPYSDLVTLTSLSGTAIIEYGESLGFLKRKRHPLGDVIFMEDDTARQMTYYRNNILHLYALPSLIACCFVRNREIRLAQVSDLIAMVYPYVRAELFLRWSDKELKSATAAALEALVKIGLVTRKKRSDVLVRCEAHSIEGMRLGLLARCTMQTLERYFIVVALLLKHGPGRLTAAELEQQCVLMAEKVSLLLEFSSSEYFDRALFKDFIHQLRLLGVVWADQNGCLLYRDALARVDEAAQLVLSEPVRLNILQITQS